MPEAKELRTGWKALPIGVFGWRPRLSIKLNPPLAEPQLTLVVQSCTALHAFHHTQLFLHSLGPHISVSPHLTEGYTEALMGGLHVYTPGVVRQWRRANTRPQGTRLPACSTATECQAFLSLLPAEEQPSPDSLLLHDVQPLGPLDDLQDGLHLGRAEALAPPLLLCLVGVHRPACLQPRENNTDVLEAFPVQTLAPLPYPRRPS